ncbi:MAG: hypothetical protein H6978_13765 [Gammaproteobacteria bacterium]|nr:hypothetical protein [Gammaproteobacteria bacterium]
MSDLNRDRFSLDVQGFAYIDCPSSVAANPAIRELNLRPDNLDHPLNHQYMAEVAARLKSLTGAREVLPQLQGLVVRTTGGPKAAVVGGAGPVRAPRLHTGDRTPVLCAG